MKIVCLDLEGVLIPEVWLGLAEKSGIEELKITTREIPDYDLLMQKRLKILAEHNLTLKDVRDVVGTLNPLPGAREFMDWLRPRFQTVILSDTYYEFIMPLMEKLGYPSIFCHKLEVDSQDRIINYQLRLQDQKTKAVQAFRQLNFEVMAAGDSYNDIGMLSAAQKGILFCSPKNIIEEHPQFQSVESYEELKEALLKG